MPPLAIETRDLVKTFERKPERGARSWLSRKPKETLTAVAGVDIEVRRGELFGLLGPNGAGKTTLVKLLATLLIPTSGSARVGGLDVVEDADAVRRKVGVVLGGERALYWRLTARENLWYFSQLYNMPGPEARRRIGELIDMVGLTDRADDRVENYSKGMKQRLHIARGLLNDPEVLLLDEPTIGLDPHAGRMLRSLVRRVVEEQNKTVVLTTHYMQEADDLSDRVAIMSRGRVIASDAPGALKRRFGGDVSAYRVAVRSVEADGVRSALARVGGGARVVAESADPAAGTVTFRVLGGADGSDAAGDLARAVADAKARLVSLTLEEATLEDVFVELTGEKLQGGGGAPE